VKNITGFLTGDDVFFFSEINKDFLGQQLKRV
jgi:hypothetical protein